MSRPLAIVPIALALFTQISAAQDMAIISGLVTDERREPVPAVHVFIGNWNVRAITAADGRYRLAVPGGRLRSAQAVTISASRAGFERNDDTITVSAGASLIRDFRLVRSAPLPASAPPNAIPPVRPQRPTEPPPPSPRPQAPTPAQGRTFGGVFTADLAGSLQAHNEMRRQHYSGVGQVEAARFQREYFVPGVTLSFFEDGAGVAQGGRPDMLQAWSGLPGVATFAWRRLPDGNIRVRFVRVGRDIMSGDRDVERLQITFEQRGSLLHPVESFAMKVGSSSYIESRRQFGMQGFAVLQACPGSWRGQTIHLYRTLPHDDPFATAAYARTAAAAPASARAAAARVNQFSYIVSAPMINSYFEDPALRCAGNPGVVY